MENLQALCLIMAATSFQWKNWHCFEFYWIKLPRGPHYLAGAVMNLQHKLCNRWVNYASSFLSPKESYTWKVFSAQFLSWMLKLSIFFLFFYSVFPSSAFLFLLIFFFPLLFYTGSFRKISSPFPHLFTLI